MNIRTIIKELEYFNYRYNNYDVLRDLFIMGALSISNSIELNSNIHKKRENEFNQISSKYNKEDMEQFAKIFAHITELYENEDISDFLGEIFMLSATQNSSAKGQVFTPFSLSQACANALVKPEDIEKNILTFYEPSVGGGGMVIAWINALENMGFDYHTKTFVVAGDIDRRCVTMTYIALSLMGVPAIIEEKDALSGELFDSFETPALKMQFLRFEKYIRSYYEKF